jgi:hypothetical protein
MLLLLVDIKLNFFNYLYLIKINKISIKSVNYAKFRKNMKKQMTFLLDKSWTHL